MTSGGLISFRVDNHNRQVRRDFEKRPGNCAVTLAVQLFCVIRLDYTKRHSKSLYCADGVRPRSILTDWIRADGERLRESRDSRSLVNPNVDV